MILQLIVTVNRPPSGGNLLVTPRLGKALETNFSVAAPGWGDAEGHLPLRYSFLALRAPKTVPIVLSSLDTTPAVKVGLGKQASTSGFFSQPYATCPCRQTCFPSSRNLTVQASILDSLGAATLVTKRNITVEPASVSYATAYLSALMTQDLTGLSPLEFNSKFLVAQELAAVGTELTDADRATVGEEGICFMREIAAALVCQQRVMTYGSLDKTAWVLDVDACVGWQALNAADMLLNTQAVLDTSTAESSASFVQASIQE
jgi:hypothetical protein